jgi:hypothetical protein
VFPVRYELNLYMLAIGMNKYSISVILHSAQGPGVYSTCDRNEYQKQKINVSGE